jgi:hypothetical protein
LNLPGSKSYDPRLPWVSRLRSDGELAASMTRFVNDLRPIGFSQESCWQTAHTLAYRYGQLGLQIAARKTRPPSQSPGAWAGAHVLVSQEGVGVTCGPDKWLKAQRILAELLCEVKQSPRLHHKTLEQRHGFLIHIQGTYPCITPFLKGLHLTLDSWRGDQDHEGWKLHGTPRFYWDDTQEIDMESPDFVVAVPRLLDDILCLVHFFSAPHPPIRFIRATQVAMVAYGFSDASGEGFGSSFQLHDGHCSLLLCV